MSWNYRVIQYGGVEIFRVHYDDKGNPNGWSPAIPYGNDPEDLRLTLNLMRGALKKPMLEIKRGKLKEVWIDPDDAPELTDEWFQNAHLYNGGKLIRKGKGKAPKLESKK